MIKLFFSSLSAILMTACSPVNMLNAMVPDDGYTAVSDIAYGNSSKQKLDIYQPAAKKSLANTPVVVFFYGGGWEDGDKKDYKFVAEALTSYGFTVVIPDYRVYPEVVFPGFVEDAAAAVAWTKKHIEDYGGDSRSLFIAGHSAGAHIAALLSLDPRYLNQQSLQPADLNGMIGLAGPYDFLPLKDKTLKKIFATAEQQQQSQPVNFVDGKNPPMLLLVGGQDLTVWPRNSHRLAEKITATGGPVELVDFPEYGHVAMVAKLAKPIRGQGALLQPIVNFVEANR